MTENRQPHDLAFRIKNGMDMVVVGAARTVINEMVRPARFQNSGEVLPSAGCDIRRKGIEQHSPDQLLLRHAQPLCGSLVGGEDVALCIQ